MVDLTENQFVNIHVGDDYKRYEQLDSLTTRAYLSKDRILMFDIHDGHLAWNFNRKTGKTEYRCDCIKRGQATLGMTLEDALEDVSSKL